MGPSCIRSFAFSCLLLSLRLAHPSVRRRGVGRAFLLPDCFLEGQALSLPLPQPQGLRGLQRCWVGPVGGSGRRPAPKRQPSRSRIPAAGWERPGCREQRSPFEALVGLHSLRGTERCLETEFNSGVRLGRVFCCCFFPLLNHFCFTLNHPLAACRSCLHPYQTPPALHQGCYPVAQIGASNSGWGLKTLRGLLFLSGRKDSLAFRRPLSASHPSAAGNSRTELLPSSLA